MNDMAAREEFEAELEAMGREITAERTRRSWSRKDLAERSGVSERQIGKIERGERGQLEEVWSIAVALGIPLSEMTSRAEQAAATF